MIEQEIKIIRSTELKAKPTDESKLGFGKLFTDHMFVVEYDQGQGWHDPRIQPYGPFSIDPASPVLHYGQEIFEGLKAYRTPADDILLFRPLDNARRMNSSAERMCMPQLDPEFQLLAMKLLVELEQDWIPRSPGTALYLRPAMIADGAELGVHAARRYYYYIICSPVGAYYAQGLAPVRIHIESEYVRAVRGGVGFAKTGGNYAASLKAAELSAAQGFDQVLWLDGRENKYVEEVGAMNMFFLLGHTLCTAPLGGSILPGITRDSVLALARTHGIKAEERPLSVEELLAAYAAGELKEAFGAGTAAVISPVGELEYQGRAMLLNQGRIGRLTQLMYNTLTDIQTGQHPDQFGWTVKVC